MFKNILLSWNPKIFHIKVSAHLASRESFQSKMTDSNSHYINHVSELNQPRKVEGKQTGGGSQQK